MLNQYEDDRSVPVILNRFDAGVCQPLFLLPWHLTTAYFLDLLLGDPPKLPHPVRWIGRLVSWAESIFLDNGASSNQQRVAGFACWICVIVGVTSATLFVTGLAFQVSELLADLVVIWLAYSCLATRSLHRESQHVMQALDQGMPDEARRRLALIVSRDTEQLDDREIIRAVIETVAENISDGIVAPLVYLSLGGLLGGMLYKAVNTMDSMLGYMNDRYRHFGWFAARADDLANWVPARLTGALILLAAIPLKLDWRSSWHVMRCDARKMKSPNAGYPECAAAGALGVQLGGANRYFGRMVSKPTLGDPRRELSAAVYRSMIRLLYVTSFLALLLSLAIRYLLCLS